MLKADDGMLKALGATVMGTHVLYHRRFACCGLILARRVLRKSQMFSLMSTPAR